MPYHKTTKEFNTVFFCTFTCFDWIPLFHITGLYEEIYKWFKLLLKSNHKLLGYVIMPNHLHFLLYFSENRNTLNQVVGSGKRFLAYEIVKRLYDQKEFNLLEKMKNAVSLTEKKNGKIHQVFEPSFDHKACYTIPFLEQKLGYIHRNPVSKKWSLAEDWKDYLHSSAGFYEYGIVNTNIELTHYKEIGI